MDASMLPLSAWSLEQIQNVRLVNPAAVQKLALPNTARNNP